MGSKYIGDVWCGEQPLYRSVSGLVLAAGRGTRFAEDPGAAVPKVLRPVLGRPMISYVLDAMMLAGVAEITIVVGYEADQVRNTLGKDYAYVTQSEQNGSGDAVKCAKDRFADNNGALVVMCGDSPLFVPDTIRRMVLHHAESGACITLVTALLDDPTGYGRVLRDEKGVITGIAEEKCASESQRIIREVNGGAYVFCAQWLFGNVDLMAKNQAGEYNLTDMVRVAVEQGKAVSSTPCDAEEVGGINTPQELKAAEVTLAGRRIL